MAHWGDIIGKVLPKAGGSEKNTKKGDGHIEGLPIEGRFKPFAYYDTERLKGRTWSPELLGGPKLEGGDLILNGDLRPLFIPWTLQAFNYE